MLCLNLCLLTNDNFAFTARIGENNFAKTLKKQNWNTLALNCPTNLEPHKNIRKKDQNVFLSPDS